MGGAESVVDKDVGQGSQFAGEFRVVLGFFLVEADIFEHQDLAVLQGGGFGLGVFADDVGGQDDRLAKQFEPGGRRPASWRIWLQVRPSGGRDGRPG